MPPVNLNQLWIDRRAKLMGKNGYHRVLQGEIEKPQYTRFLCEAYQIAREARLLETLFQRQFPQVQPSLSESSVRQILSTLSQEDDILQDLDHLGVSFKDLTSSRPLATTEVLTAIPYRLVQLRHLEKLLGFFYHTVSEASLNGKEYMTAFTVREIPHEAQSFLESHIEVSGVHRRMIEKAFELELQRRESLQQFEEGLSLGILATDQMISQIFGPNTQVTKN